MGPEKTGVHSNVIFSLGIVEKKHFLTVHFVLQSLEIQKLNLLRAFKHFTSNIVLWECTGSKGPERYGLQAVRFVVCNMVVVGSNWIFGYGLPSKHMHYIFARLPVVL